MTVSPIPPHLLSHSHLAADASCTRHFHDSGAATYAWHHRLCIVKLGLHSAGSHESPGEVDQYISSG